MDVQEGSNPRPLPSKNIIIFGDPPPPPSKLDVICLWSLKKSGQVYLKGHNLQQTQFTADQIFGGPNCRNFEANFGELGPANFQKIGILVHVFSNIFGTLVKLLSTLFIRTSIFLYLLSFLLTQVTLGQASKCFNTLPYLIFKGTISTL